MARVGSGGGQLGRGGGANRGLLLHGDIDCGDKEVVVVPSNGRVIVVKLRGSS